jgi:hypothetical protein
MSFFYKLRVNNEVKNIDSKTVMFHKVMAKRQVYNV